MSSYFLRSITNVYDSGRIDMLGQVTKVHYIDDKNNVSKQFVEYDVSVRDAYGGQSTYSNVRLANSLVSGTNDYDEVILESNEYASQGKLSEENLYKNQNGALVIVSFINGSIDKPYITGIIPHPTHQGAKRSDGIRKKGEFRGLEWEINKLGELTLTYNGNKAPDGTPQRPNSSGTKINIDQTGSLTLSDNKSQTIKIDREAKTIEVSTGDISIKLDGNSDKVTIGTPAVELLQQISDQLDKLATWANTVGATHTHIGNLGVPTPLDPAFVIQYQELALYLEEIKNNIATIGEIS